MLERIKKLYKQSIHNTIIIYGFIIGLFSGVVAAIFYYVLEFMIYFLNEFIVGKELVKPAGEHLHFNIGSGLGLGFVFFILPIFGSLVSGLLTYYFAPLAKGNGTDATIEVFHKKKGELKLKDSFIKAIASIFVLSSNGSSGREGPILQICGGIGSFIADIRKKNTVKKRIFLLAGAAGGLGAIFRAPLGGALTSIEVLYKEDFESEALLPCVVSSVTAYTVFTLIFGHRAIYSLGVLDFHYRDLVYYLLLGFLCAGAGYVYSSIMDFVRERANSLKIKPYLIPVIGGVFVSIIGYFIPESLGSGAGVLQLALYGKYTALIFFVIAIAKMFTTSFTIGMGSSGGLFGPSLVIGAMLGGGFAYSINHFFPGTINYPSSFIVVGMASFFAGVANAPIASVIMVCEMTGSYVLLPPLLLVSVISIFLSKKSIFKNQVKNRLFSMAHHQETAECFLRQKKVREIYKKYKQDDVVYSDMNVSTFFKFVDLSHNSDFIVIDRDGKLVGGVSLSECKFNRTGQSKHKNPMKVSDLARKVNYVNLDDDLYVGLQKFLHERFYKIPAIDDYARVKGFIRYRDIIRSLQNPETEDCK